MTNIRLAKPQRQNWQRERRGYLGMRCSFLRLTAIVAFLYFLTSQSVAHGQQNQTPSATPASAPAATLPEAYKHTLAVPPPAASSVPTKPGVVGSDTCAICHSDIAKKFGTNPHSQLALMHGGKGVTCESCHGPGQAHVDSGGDKTKIFDFNTAPVKAIDAKCLSCHADSHPNFDRSPHNKAGVGCTSCHSTHAAESPEHLLKIAEPKLCFSCHTDIKASFSQPFHHKVNEGLITCTDCHNPHGTFGNNNLKSTADQNAICVKCHTETRGPFVFEHAPVKAEGCVGCHTPHGSQNARLLNMPNVNTLCNQCHSPVSSATVHGMGAGSSELTPCVNCHTNIHGSNINPAFLR